MNEGKACGAKRGWLLATLLALVGLGVGCRGGAGSAPPIRHDSTDAAGGHERGEMAPGEVMIDARRQQLLGVTHGTVERRSLERSVRTVGVVEYDESRLSDISLKFGGWIERLRADETGVLIRRGQVLFDLYSPELVSTQEEYLTAWDYRHRLDESGSTEMREAADRLLEAAGRRLAFWDIDPKHVRDLERDRLVLRTLPIHAPARGHVVEKHVVAGTHVKPGQLLYRLADLDEVWVLADVYEHELDFVGLGQAATVTLSYLPGVTLQGKVSHVYPYLERSERTVKIRVQLENPNLLLKEGMYANVELRHRRDNVLVIPEEAIIDSGERQVVFISRAEGRFEPREVTLGSSFDGLREVLSGLSEGESVVTSANFLVDSESQLSAGMRQMQH